MSSNINGMTVKELYMDCKTLMANGMGDKRIYISRDDEGNGFHTLYYSFTTDSGEIKETLDYLGEFVDKREADNIVLLG